MRNLLVPAGGPQEEDLGALWTDTQPQGAEGEEMCGVIGHEQGQPGEMGMRRYLGPKHSL